MRTWRYRLGHLALLLAFLAVIALVGLLILRPGAVLGVSGSALAHSLRGETGGVSDRGSCAKTQGGDWRCTVHGASSAGGATYRVTTHGLGCWDATRIGHPGVSGAPPTASSCLTVLDVARVF